MRNRRPNWSVSVETLGQMELNEAAGRCRSGLSVLVSVTQDFIAKTADFLSTV